MNTKCIIGGVALLIFSSCGNKQTTEKASAPPAEYPTVTAHAQDTTVYAEYPALIRGQEDIDVKPRLEGVIEEIYVDEGATVKRGQRLFRLNSPQTIQMLATAQQALVSAQAQVNTAKLDVDRMSGLAEKGIISNVQLEALQNTYRAARAAQAQAQAQLSSAQSTSGWMTVTSPVDGMVGTIPYRQGSLVNSATSLTTVANTENIYAYFSLNEKILMDLLQSLDGANDAEKINNIPEVTLILADGTVYPEKGKVETISGVINSATGSANFRAKFPNREGILRSGTSGKVQIPRSLDHVIVIPQKATFNLQDKVLVFMVQGDSVVQKVVEVIPIPGGRDYAVTGGITEGERIVTDGVATLNNGQKITTK